MAAMPTAPVPNTAILLPRRTFIDRNTAPAPVKNPHPIDPTHSSGMSSDTGIADRPATTACVANEDCPKKWLLIEAPARDSELLPSSLPMKLCCVNSRQ
jgi:hypothetical protein